MVCKRLTRKRGGRQTDRETERECEREREREPFDEGGQMVMCVKPPKVSAIVSGSDQMRSGGGVKRSTLQHTATQCNTLQHTTTCPR